MVLCTFKFAMKKASALTALLLVLLYAAIPVQAQIWNNSTSASWQSAAWGLGTDFPGSASTNTLNALIANTSAITISNATPPFPIGSLTISSTNASTLGNTAANLAVTLNGSGTLVINGDLTVDNPLVIGAELRIVVNGTVRGSTPILISNGGLLRLTSTAATAIQSTASISAGAAGGAVELAAGWNAGFLLGAIFGSATSPFNGTLRIGSTFTLSSPLVIGSGGRFDFSTTATRLILASPATILGTVVNAGAARYFVTTSYPLALGNVGSTTFPVGPSPTIFSPLNITNNGSPATFSVKALPEVTQVPPFAMGSTVLRQSIVNQQWNVSQLTGLTPGVSVSISPSWVAGQENAGFNRAIAVVNAFTTSIGTVSSASGAAASDPTYFGYLRSGVTLTQNAKNLLNNTPILVSSQPAPNIFGVTPRMQSSGGTLTIIGSRFAPGASVSLGGIRVPAANVNFISSTSGIDTLYVIVPSNARSGEIVVSQIGGITVFFTGYVFIGPSLLTAIFRVSPNAIPAGIGDVEVMISGIGFGRVNPKVIAVGNGITSAITPHINTTNRIFVTIPSILVRQEGNLNLTITSNQNLPVSTTVTIATASSLTLTSLSPSVTSSNLQPFTILVNGDTFSSQSLFTLGKDTLRLIDVSRNMDGSLTARVVAPAGVQSGNLTVTNINNQAASLPFLVGTVGVFVEPVPQLRVFPNPAEDIVSVEAHYLTGVTALIRITNILGQSVLVAEEPVMGGKFRRTFNLSALAQGTYLLEIRDGIQRIVQKIFKR